MKNLKITVLFFLIIALSYVLIDVLPSKVNQNAKTEFEQEIDLKLKAQEAEKFCIDNGMNQDFCILIDMSKHSGKNRFYVWSFIDQEPIAEHLVAHGCGDNPHGHLIIVKPIQSSATRKTRIFHHLVNIK